MREFLPLTANNVNGLDLRFGEGTTAAARAAIAAADTRYRGQGGAFVALSIDEAEGGFIAHAGRLDIALAPGELPPVGLMVPGETAEAALLALQVRLVETTFRVGTPSLVPQLPVVNILLAASHLDVGGRRSALRREPVTAARRPCGHRTDRPPGVGVKCQCLT